MKQAELKELKSKNLKDLIKKTQELRKEMSEILIEASLGKLKDSHKIRAKRKEIAQALTFAAQKNFESQLSAQNLPENKEKQK